MVEREEQSLKHRLGMDLIDFRNSIKERFLHPEKQSKSKVSIRP
jgi:hypothetical protein